MIRICFVSQHLTAKADDRAVQAPAKVHK